MIWPELPSWSYEIAKYVAGGIFGAILKSLRDRRRALSQQRELIRGLIACTERLTRGLHRVSIQVNNLEPGPAVAIAFFTVEAEIIAPDDLGELSQKVRSNTILPQRDLQRLRDAEESVSRAQRRFNSLRTQSVLPGHGAVVLSELPALRDAVSVAKVSLVQAISAMRRLAAKDTREVIDRLLSEVR